MKYLLSLFLFLSLVSTGQAEVFLHDTKGQDIPLSSLKGKWIFINYWARWCTPCIAEIPELNRFYQKHAKDPVALFAVNYDALPMEQQNSLIKALNIHYPSLLVDPASDLNLGDIVGVPVTFVINPKGTLIHTLYGEQAVKTLDKIMNS